MDSCAQCGTQGVEGSKFCAKCGAPLSSSEAALVEVAADPPAAAPAPYNAPPPPPPAAYSAPPITRYCSGCGAGLVATAVTCPSCGTKVTRGGGSGSKSKTTAVLLACFLSFWTWLYTYKKNTWKFWVGLVVGIVGIALSGIPAIGVWIWAIVDVSVKPRSYYEDYDS